MEKKPVAAIAVAIILLVLLLTQFVVPYPYNPNEIVQVTNQNFFGGNTPQIPPLGKFGINNTNLSGFNPTVKTNVTIEGFATNASTGLPIAGKMIAITIYPATAKTTTNQNGYFSFNALYSGTGVFAFKIPYYKTIYKTLALTPPVTWANLSFSPASSYSVSGSVHSSSGSVIPNTSVQFGGFFYNSGTFTDSNGVYSLKLYNDTYAIRVYYPNYNSIPAPMYVNMTGSSITGLNLVISPLTNYLHVSGFVSDPSKLPIDNAKVVDYSNNIFNYSISSGFYSVNVTTGSNIISFSHTGYATNITMVNAAVNVTDYNVTLHIADPFGNNGNEVNGSTYDVNGTSLYNWLGNNSSSVDYSLPGNYVIEGRVSTTVTGNRVVYLSDVNVTFYTSVNGSFFSETVKTNSTGWYVLPLSYEGTYKFLITTYLTYPFKTQNILVVSPVTYYNVSLEAIPGYIIQFKGSIQNNILDRNVQNSTLNFRGESNSTETISGTYYSTNGSFSLYLIVGNYTIVASGPGYQNNYSLIGASELRSNNGITFLIKPILIPSVGFSNINGNTNTEGIQGLTSVQLKDNLSSDSLTYNYANLNLSIEFKYNNLPVSDQWLGLYLATDGLYFFKAIQTDSNGFYYLHLGFSGKFSILAESQKYQGTGIRNLSVVKNSTLLVNLSERQVYPISILLYDSVTMSYVPQQVLNLTNSAVPINFTISQQPDGTIYSYYLPNGSYDFNYSNPGYISKDFYLNVSGNSNSTSVSIDPKEIVIHANSSYQWGFTLTYPGGSNTTNSIVAGQSNWTEHGTTGTNTLTDWMYYNNVSQFIVNTTTFSLSSSVPYRVIYINITESSLLFNLSYLNYSTTSGNTNATYQVNVGGGYFYSFIFNASISSFDLFVKGLPVTVGSFGPDTFNGSPATIVNLSNPLQIYGSAFLSVEIHNDRGLSASQLANIGVSYIASSMRVVS